MNLVNKNIYNGIPTKSKLLKRFKESEERRINNLETNKKIMEIMLLIILLKMMKIIV